MLPLWLVGAPLEWALSSSAAAAFRAALGRFGGALTPAVGVDTVAAAAVAAATGELGAARGGGGGGGGSGGGAAGGGGAGGAGAVRVLDYDGMAAAARLA